MPQKEDLGELLQRIRDRYVVIRHLVGKGQYPEKTYKPQTNIQDVVTVNKKSQQHSPIDSILNWTAAAVLAVSIPAFGGLLYAIISTRGNDGNPLAYPTQTVQAMQTAYVGAVQTAQAQATQTPTAITPVPTLETLADEYYNLIPTYVLFVKETFSPEQRNQFMQDVLSNMPQDDSKRAILADPAFPQNITQVHFDYATNIVDIYPENGDTISLHAYSEQITRLLKKYMTPENSGVFITDATNTQLWQSERFIPRLSEILAGTTMTNNCEQSCSVVDAVPESTVESTLRSYALKSILVSDFWKTIQVITDSKVGSSGTVDFALSSENYQAIRHEIYTLFATGQ